VRGWLTFRGVSGVLGGGVTGDEKSGRRTGGKGRVGRWDGGVFGAVSGEWADWG
jgi:hypothetical protein